MNADYLEVLDSDNRRECEAQLWKGRASAFMKPGSKYIYWRAPDTSAIRAVYNIPLDFVPRVVDRIRHDRTQPYGAIVGDIPGAGFADEGHDIDFVSGSSSG
jgi:hypothetical protein